MNGTGIDAASADLAETEHALIPITGLGGALEIAEALADASERARSYAKGSRAEATHRAYQSDWRHYTAWCAEHGLVPLPATSAMIGMYLAVHATTLAVTTLTRRLSAISIAHRLTGHHIDTRHPAIRDVLRGVRRTRGSAQRHAEALTTPLLRRVLDTCGPRLIDTRDRALILIGYAAALRQSEIVALDVADITITPEGLRIAIRRSKGDQDGEGQVVSIGRTGSPTCPTAAYGAWLERAGIAEGAVFRRVDRHGRLRPERLQPEAVAALVRARAERAGLDAQGFSGHSLRAGLATSAAAAGIEERVIMRTTRHRSATTLRRYIREGSLWENNLAREVGL